MPDFFGPLMTKLHMMLTFVKCCSLYPTTCISSPLRKTPALSELRSISSMKPSVDEGSGGAVPAHSRRPITTGFISKEVTGSKGLSRHVASEMSERETTPRDTCWDSGGDCQAKNRFLQKVHLRPFHFVLNRERRTHWKTATLWNSCLLCFF